MFLDFPLVYWVAYIVGVALVGIYLVAPLKFWVRRRMPARPKFERFELDAIEQRASDYLAKHAADLLALGFEEPTHLRLNEIGTLVTSYMILAVDRATGTVGSVAVSLLGFQRAQRLARTSFASRTDAGELVMTTNLVESALFVPPGSTVLQVPSVGDVAELLELHRVAVKKHPPTGRPVVYEPCGEAEYLSGIAFREYYDELVRRGLLWHNAAKDVYRFTLVGAYLLTWAGLFPAKLVLEARVRREERRVLAEYRDA